MTCELCGQDALGFATSGKGQRLCHDEERDCYHLWTVYGARSLFDCPHPDARRGADGVCMLCGRLAAVTPPRGGR